MNGTGILRRAIVERAACKGRRGAAPHSDSPAIDITATTGDLSGNPAVRESMRCRRDVRTVRINAATSFQCGIAGHLAEITILELGISVRGVGSAISATEFVGVTSVKGRAVNHKRT